MGPGTPISIGGILRFVVYTTTTQYFVDYDTRTFVACMGAGVVASVMHYAVVLWRSKDRERATALPFYLPVAWASVVGAVYSMSSLNNPFRINE